VNTTKIAMKTEGFIVGSFLVLPIVLAYLVWLANGNERGGFADARILSVRYIASVLVLMALMIPFFYVAHTRKVGAPLKWGEAMVGAAYVFFLLFWLYGVVPHEYLQWADSELAWRADKKVIGPEGSWSSWASVWARVPLTIHLEVIRDIVVATLYVIGLGGFIWGFAFWNDRQKMMDAKPEAVSTYGRPLVTKANG
jgi:hypothetical protein